MSHDAAGFVFGEDEGEAFGVFGADELAQFPDGDAQHFAEHEDDGVEGLVLGGGSHIAVGGQVGEKRVDGLRAEGGRVLGVMEIQARR